MSKIIRLTENDLIRLVNKVIKEQNTKTDGENDIYGGFLNKIKNILREKGYNNVKKQKLNIYTENLISMAKGNNKVENFSDDEGDFIQLSKNNHPNYEFKKIYFSGLKDINGPYKVEYYTRVGDEKPKLIKTENNLFSITVSILVAATSYVIIISVIYLIKYY